MPAVIYRPGGGDGGRGLGGEAIAATAPDAGSARTLGALAVFTSTSAEREAGGRRTERHEGGGDPGGAAVGRNGVG